MTTTAELIKALSRMPQDAPILLSGFTWLGDDISVEDEDGKVWLT